MWHTYEDVFYDFLLGCVASMTATVVCFFFFIIVMTFLVRKCYGSPKKQEFLRIFKKNIDQPV
jgi:hypothetical protein